MKCVSYLFLVLINVLRLQDLQNLPVNLILLGYEGDGEEIKKLYELLGDSLSQLDALYLLDAFCVFIQLFLREP